MQPSAPIVNTCQTAWPWSQYSGESRLKHQEQEEEKRAGAGHRIANLMTIAKIERRIHDANRNA